jgi:hypothetical protein
MSLKEILQAIDRDEPSTLLCERGKDWKAAELLISLSSFKLSLQVHLQPGLYIAEINPGGYLGTVLYRIKIQK